jgi:hypothetical protein
MLACDNDSSPLASVQDGLRSAVTPEQVARVVTGISVIGEACRALQGAGWQATLAGNRITVDNAVFAQLITASTSRWGPVEATWTIRSISGAPPVWMVGAGST